MEKGLATAIIAAVLGGAVGSGVTLAVSHPWTPEPETKAARQKRTLDDDTKRSRAESSDEAPGPTSRRSGSDDARFAALERRVKVLTAALAQQDQRGDGGSAAPGGAVDVADPVFEVAVMDIIDRVEAQKKEERDERRDEMRRQFSARMSDELETALGLTAEQKRKLGEVIAAHFDAIRALRDAEDRPATRAEWRKRIDAVTAQSEHELEAFLSPDQMSSYRELDAEQRIGGGWGRGRPDR